MKAVVVDSGQRLAPFGDLPGETPILTSTLASVQARALSEAGLELVTEAPAAERYLAISDRTWVTPELLLKMVDAGAGRLRVTDPRWTAELGEAHDMPEPGLFEVGVFEGGVPEWSRLSPMDVDLQLSEHPMDDTHPSMAHAARPVLYSRALVMQVDHWVRVLHANRLALLRLGDDGRTALEAASWLSKLSWLVSRAWRAGSTDKYAWARAVGEQGQGCDVHPTAVVEVSQLGDNVVVGPHAVVRGSVLGDGARIDEHATVNLSVVGEGARVGRYAMANISVLYPGAMISHGDGFQACLFGRDCFVAWGAVALDLSFGKPVRVWHRGELRDSGQHFVGACVGHRARVMNGVRINYGMHVPNDAMVAPSAETLLRDWGDAPTDGPVVVEHGVARPLRRK